MITLVNIVTIGTDTVITSVGWVVHRSGMSSVLGIIFSVRVPLPRYALSSASSNVFSLYLNSNVRLASVIAASPSSVGSGIAPFGLSVVRVTKDVNKAPKDISTKGKAIDSAGQSLGGAYGDTPNSADQPRS